MNKSKLNKIVFILVITNVIFFTIFSITYRRVQSVPQPETKTITVTDTLTNVVYDTLFIDHFEIVKLPVVDTLILINDSIRVDSVFVEVPISVYKFDSTFTTDTTSLNIRIQNSGYEVTLDSLSYYFEYTPRLQKRNYFKEHFKFGAGVSTGYGCFSKQPDIFLGIGFYYCF